MTRGLRADQKTQKENRKSDGHARVHGKGKERRTGDDQSEKPGAQNGLGGRGILSNLACPLSSSGVSDLILIFSISSISFELMQSITTSSGFAIKIFPLQKAIIVRKNRTSHVMQMRTTMMICQT